MNLPNSLTVLRIFFVPLLVVVLLTRQPNWNFWGPARSFRSLGCLDFAGGRGDRCGRRIHRAKRREITTLGILLDPVADKLLISAAFIPLVQMHLVQAWMVVIIIGREFIVMGLREIASVEGLVIPGDGARQNENDPAGDGRLRGDSDREPSGAENARSWRCCGWWC